MTKTDTQNSKEKRYNLLKLRTSLISGSMGILYIAFLAFSGISFFLYDFIKSNMAITNEYIIFCIFVAITTFFYFIISLPFNYYNNFSLEHEYGLSNESLSHWIGSIVKSIFVSILVATPILLVFYALISISRTFWWFYFSIILFMFTIVLARITPIFILPLFYKFKKLDNREITEKLITLIGNQKINISGIYVYNMSKETKKANAGFTGVGKSRRIILSDTLIREFTPAEVAVVFAHELGHYKKNHIIKNIAISTFTIFLSFFLCNIAYSNSLPYFGFTFANDIPALPLLFFYLTIISIFLIPITNIISRHFEKEADMFALTITRHNETFISTMEKLSALNLADKSPHPVIEFLFYSHPSIKKRIEFAVSYFSKGINIL